MVVLNAADTYSYCCAKNSIVLNAKCACESTNATNKYYSFSAGSNTVCISAAECVVANYANHLQADGVNSPCTCLQGFIP